MKKRSTTSTEQYNSRYTQGGLTDTYSNRLGWWERTPIPPGDDDLIVEVTAKTAGRPDLIAHTIYGRSTLGWVILQANNIVDINEETKIGTKLRVPSPSRLSGNILINHPGGNKK